MKKSYYIYASKIAIEKKVVEKNLYEQNFSYYLKTQLFKN